ncbi:beta-lactamase [Bacillus sp. TS-2]|nr:beta-lactamase [Bacillus sp. TS-2]
MKYTITILTAVLLFLSIFSTPLVLAETLDETTPSGVSFEDLDMFINEYVDEYIGETLTGASVILLKNGEVVFSKGYGLADMDNGKEVDPDTTLMEWGSVSKVVTWIAVMQLVEEGKIDLNEDISTYLPDSFLTKLSYSEPITMYHLMHHTAGFEEYLFDLGYSDPTEIVSLKEGLIKTEPNQVYPPGEVVAYSNYSTALAGYIVELLSGQSFDDYVEDHIFEPLGMDTTEYNVVNHEEMAKGYVQTGPRQFQEYQPFYMSLYPAGALSGSAMDLAKLASALTNQEEALTLFKDVETLNTFLTTSYSPVEGFAINAHGLWEYKGNYRGLGHGGNTDAFSANFHLVPEQQFSIVILTNQAGEIDVSIGLIEALVTEMDHSVDSNEVFEASSVEGTYLSGRRTHNSFINLYYYLIPLKVTSLNDNEINVSLAGMDATYVQTQPYLYEMVTGAPFYHTMKEIYFHVENGHVSKISAPISDYLPLPQSKTSLYIQAVLFVICSVYFLLSPFILIVRWIVSKIRKKKVFEAIKWSTFIQLFGFGMLVNTMVLIIRMLSNFSRSYSDIKVHFFINYLFTGLITISIILLSIYAVRNRLTKGQKFSSLISIVMAIIFLLLLMTWSFYQ